MAGGVLWNDTWLPDALRTKLTHSDSGQLITTDVKSWLSDLRHAVHDYEEWTGQKHSIRYDPNLKSIEVKPSNKRQSSEDVFSNAFDDILSTLGNEIYQLDSYQRKHSQGSNAKVSIELEHEIMHMFNDCLQEVPLIIEPDSNSKSSDLKKVPSYSNISMLSDEVFLKSESKIDQIFDKGNGKPVPPKRKNRSNSSNLETQKTRPVSMMDKLLIYKNDSDSGNNSPSNDYSDYQNLWHCTSSARLKENYGLINTINFDSAQDITDSSLDISNRKVSSEQSRVNSTASSGSRTESEGVSCVKGKSCVESDKRYSYDGRNLEEERSKMVQFWKRDMLQCTSDCDLSDDCHRSLANTGHISNSFVFKPGKAEAIYENVEALRSLRTEPKGLIRKKFLEMSDANGKTGSTPSLFMEEDFVSDSDSWRTPMDHGRTSSSMEYVSESPIYENLQDLRLKQPNLTADVLHWKAVLLDPFWNDDEEDEWVSKEEAAEYAREQNPPFVIPKIKQFKPKTYQNEEKFNEEPTSPSVKDARKKFEEGFGNKNNDSAKIVRSPPKYVVNIENTPARLVPYQLIAPESSPIELRKHGDGLRPNKSKSMITTADKKGELNKNQPLKRVLPKLYDPSMHVQIEGYVYRTKLTENGKKVRKNWQKEYAVMTQTSLAFYKDKKMFDSTKDSKDKDKNNVSPEAIIPLAGALVTATTAQQTSRPNALIITSTSFNQHLIYHEEPRSAQHWCDSIVKAINKLPSDYKCPENANVTIAPAGTPSPTHKHVMRIKPSSKVMEGSVEDLCDLPEHAAVRSKLKKFFIRRPTMESLIKNKIYEDEPVFGRTLDKVCPETNPQIPEFVIRCIKAIEASEENMNSDGIYRVSGNLSQVQKIRMEVNSNNLDILDKESDVHVLTGTLKLFFRELKEPLIPCKLFQRCLNASSNNANESRIKEFREIVDNLPECNRQTLKYLLEHLLRVTTREEKNRMHIANVAIVLGPTLLRAPPETSQNMAFECLQQNRVIELLMCDFDRIFKDDNKRKK